MKTREIADLPIEVPVWALFTKRFRKLAKILTLEISLVSSLFSWGKALVLKLLKTKTFL